MIQFASFEMEMKSAGVFRIRGQVLRRHLEIFISEVLTTHRKKKKKESYSAPKRRGINLLNVASGQKIMEGYLALISVPPGPFSH